MEKQRCEECEKDFSSAEALGMHNKSKHADTYKEPKGPWLTSKRKKKIKKYAIWSIIIILIVGLFYWWLVPPKDAPIIEIAPSFHNFGDVSQAEGAVDTTMTITNRGVDDLIINNMDTSCGCTSAAIVKDGMEGPRFSMANHGTNPKGYEMRIPSGKSVELKVYYNPNVHKDMRGSVTRSVFVYSNDHRNSKQEVRITANQVN